MTGKKDGSDFMSTRVRSDLVPINGRTGADIRLRSNPTREELRTLDELHRQDLTLRVEKLLISLAAIKVEEIAEYVQQIGLRLMQQAQENMTDAEETLNQEYLRKFRAFADRSLGQGAHDILQIQALGTENIMDIIVDSPNFKNLPPEKRSLISRLFGRG